MSFSDCPFCNQLVPTAELERHANNHFDDDNEQIEKDLALARAIELSSVPSPPKILVDSAKPCEYQKRKSSKSSFARCEGRINGCEELTIYFDSEDEESVYGIELAQAIELSSVNLPHNSVEIANPCEIPRRINCETECSSTKCEGRITDARSKVEGKIGHLLSLQIRETYYKVKGGLISLLQKCLEVDSENSTSILSGYVDHFQSTESEDSGWGCGWRNIQLLSSHLLMHRQEAKEVLFGGSGFVPDIASLQRWLEIAWEMGFDTLGSNHFNSQIYGKVDWIGTTECATIFRSFGLRARIVDFCSKPSESITSASCSSRDAKKKATKVYGPMDKFLSSANDSFSQVASSGNGKDKDLRNYPGKGKGHQLLIDWVWSYFSDDRFGKSGNARVILSEKAPLYFQHNGHSRTIVGIQVKRSRNGMQQYNLLVIDPGHKTEGLERSLRLNSGWQKLIKRGVHTLKKLEYQLCYIDPGIATGEEMEKLKNLNSVYFEF